MLRSLLFLLLASCSLSGRAQHARNNASSQPRQTKTVVTDRQVYDFGDIKEREGKADCVITLTNKGKKAVAISDVRTFCGCAAPSYSREPVQPGGKTRLIITYNPENRSGRFSKDVYIILNGGDNYVQTKITGNVVPYLHPVTEEYPYAFGEGLYMSNRVVPFAYQGKDIRQTTMLRIANDTRQPMEIVISKRPANKVLRVPAKITLKPLERTTIDCSYAYPRQYSRDRVVWLDIKVNGKAVKPMKVIFYGSQNVLHMK